MAHLDLEHLNYLAIGAAGLAAFGIGAVWYTGLFGKAWARQHGYSPEQLKQMQAKRPMPIFFGVLIVSYLAAAFAMAILLGDHATVNGHMGVHVGLLAWVIVAAFRMTAHISSPKPIGAFLIDSGFDLVALPVMGLILASWR